MVSFFVDLGFLPPPLHYFPLVLALHMEVAGRNEMTISCPSQFISVWYCWGSTPTSNNSAASKGCLTQMFWSVVFVKITGTPLAFSITHQLFTTKPCAKLWCAACSTIYYWPLQILEVFPGTVSMAFPGIHIGSLSLLICTVLTGPSRRLLKFCVFLYTTSPPRLVAMDSVYMQSPSLTSLTTAGLISV